MDKAWLLKNCREIVKICEGMDGEDWFQEQEENAIDYMIEIAKEGTLLKIAKLCLELYRDIDPTTADKENIEFDKTWEEEELVTASNTK